jgi:hypothetical protein
MDLDDPTCKYDDHFIFALPIFKSTLFRQFRDQLRQQMDSASATSPLVDSLSVNAPAIHQEFQDKVRASDLSYHQLGRIPTSVDKVVKGIEHGGKVSDRTDRRNESIDKTVRNLDTNMTKLASDIGQKNTSRFYQCTERPNGGCLKEQLSLGRRRSWRTNPKTNRQLPQRHHHHPSQLSIL